MQNPLEGPISRPLLEVAMARLVGRIATRQFLPLRSRAKNPQRSVQDFARVLPWPAATVLAPPVHRQQRLDELPLGLCEIHSSIPKQGAGSFREFAGTGRPSVAFARNVVSGF